MRNPLARAELTAIQEKVHLFLQVHRYEAAEKLIKSTLSTHGPLANLHNLLGLTYHLQSRFVEAIEQFEGALKANPAFIEAGLNLTATLCDLSRYEEAREIFSSLHAQVGGQRKQPRMVLGRIANLHATVGRTYEECGLIPEAIQEYTKALSLFSDMPDIQMSAARLLIKAGQTAKAQARLEELVKADSSHWEARTLLGLVYFKLGRRDLAKDQWAIAQQSNPDDATSRAFLHLSKSWSPIDINSGQMQGI